MSRKKTHEEYVKELAEKNPNVEVVGIYCGANIKIPHRCKKCGNVWSASPHNLLSDRGCPICAGNIKRTQEEYVNQVKLVNKNIEVIGKYITNATPILHKCHKHDIEWNSTPYQILNGSGCPICAKESFKKTRSKTNEEYVNELKDVNKDIVSVEEYINAQTPILHKCLICNFEWKVSPNCILSQKSGCPMCVWNKKRTHEEYIEQAKSVNENIEVIGKYVNAKTPIMHHCKIHNIYWDTAPMNILKGCGCEKCHSEKIRNALRKTRNQYIKELENTGKNIILIDDYINSLTPVTHKCITCGFTWKVAPSNILYNTGCPHCNISKGEITIEKWLISHNISFESQKKFSNCKDQKNLPFDFYIPFKNMCIEYDGEQHFKPIEYFGGEKTFKTRQKHDKIKNDFCKENGISLLRIPYYKFDNIEEELNNFIFI